MKDANGLELVPGDLVVHKNYWDDYDPGEFTLALFRVIAPYEETRVEVIPVIGKLRNAVTDKEAGNIGCEYIYKYPSNLPQTKEHVIAFRRLIGLEV
jgi:hypothetical protein